MIIDIADFMAKINKDLYIGDTGVQLSALAKLVNLIYPVGSIYISVSSTNPSTILGGSWTQISGRFLYCTTTSKTTGGSTTTGSTALTVNQIPSHTHAIHERVLFWDADMSNKLANTAWSSSGAFQYQGYDNATTATGGSQGHTHSQNLPPYFTVYCWYRTA